MTEFLSTVERINSELLTFTYGSLIVRLIKDYEKPEEINEQLEKMGYNIGIRIIDDYLAKSCISPPQTFKQAIEIIQTKAMPFYLKIKVDTIVYSSKEYGLTFVEILLMILLSFRISTKTYGTRILSAESSEGCLSRLTLGLSASIIKIR